jgi:putative transcriptional regulator
MNRKIKIARVRKNLNQRELCEIVGIGINTLVKLEKGNFSSLKYPLMIRLAKSLDTTVQELFFSEEE